MTLIKDITIYELCSLVFSVVAGGAAIVAAWFAVHQWVRSIKHKRAELVKEAYTKIRDDEGIVEVLYTIDYGEVSWYSDDFLGDHELEAKFDRAFAFFDYLCYLKQRRILTSKDFRMFEYRIYRMAINYDVQSYLYNLYHFAKTNGTVCSFINLINYMRKKKLLPKGFLNKDSDIYEKRLDF